MFLNVIKSFLFDLEEVHISILLYSMNLSKPLFIVLRLFFTLLKRFFIFQCSFTSSLSHLRRTITLFSIVPNTIVALMHKLILFCFQSLLYIIIYKRDLWNLIPNLVTNDQFLLLINRCLCFFDPLKEKRRSFSSNGF